MTVPLSHGDRKLAVGLKISNSLELLTAHDDMGGLLLLPSENVNENETPG